MELFDTHAHLDDEQFDDIRGEVFHRCIEAAVQNVVVIGTTKATSEKCIAIAEEYEIASAAVGIQPNCCGDAVEGDWQRIVELAAHPLVVAIGETGLDRYWDYAPFELQQDYFNRHIELSLELEKPFVVHMRDCGNDILESLQRYQGQSLNGVMHSFTGDLELAQHCLEFGLYVSFAGMVTFKKSDELRAVAREIPSDRLLIETDAPYLSPHPKRGQRPNEPSLIVHTAECLAQVRNVSLAELAKVTTENARRLFGLEQTSSTREI